jgi:hypothetical protein
MFTGSRDPAIIVRTLRENWSGSLQHQRPLSTSRAYAELVKLLDGCWTARDTIRRRIGAS